MPGDKGKGNEVEHSPSSSTTPIDPKIEELLRETEDTAKMAPRKRHFKQVLQERAKGAAQSS